MWCSCLSHWNARSIAMNECLKQTLVFDRACTSISHLLKILCSSCEGLVLSLLFFHYYLFLKVWFCPCLSVFKKFFRIGGADLLLYCFTMVSGISQPDHLVAGALLVNVLISIWLECWSFRDNWVLEWLSLKFCWNWEPCKCRVWSGLQTYTKGGCHASLANWTVSGVQFSVGVAYRALLRHRHHLHCPALATAPAAAAGNLSCAACKAETVTSWVLSRSSLSSALDPYFLVVCNSSVRVP